MVGQKHRWRWIMLLPDATNPSMPIHLKKRNGITWHTAAHTAMIATGTTAWSGRQSERWLSAAHALGEAGRPLRCTAVHHLSAPSRYGSMLQEACQHARDFLVRRGRPPSCRASIAASTNTYDLTNAGHDLRTRSRRTAPPPLKHEHGLEISAHGVDGHLHRQNGAHADGASRSSALRIFAKAGSSTPRVAGPTAPPAQMPMADTAPTDFGATNV